MVVVYIGVGSNINPDENIPRALQLLQKKVKVCMTSTFYYTHPLYHRDQADYCNGVWKMSTTLSPYDLKLKVLREIELALGRTRSTDKYASRSIDLDILLYGKDVINTEYLTIPDPDIYTRPFICIPLLEISPHLIIPDTGKAIDRIVLSMKDSQMESAFTITNQLKKGIAYG